MRNVCEAHDFSHFPWRTLWSWRHQGWCVVSCTRYWQKPWSCPRLHRMGEKIDSHLNDTKSYSKITEDDWLFRRQKVLETWDKLVNSYSRFLPPNLLKFLCSVNNNPRSLDPAKFYIIPKIHKSPIAGRPIAASHSYITCPISIFVDELVKPSITMPMVLCDLGNWSNVWRHLSYLPIAFLSPRMCHMSCHMSYFIWWVGWVKGSQRADHHHFILTLAQRRPL